MAAWNPSVAPAAAISGPQLKRPESVEEAAAQFEALLTKQLLSAARAAGDALGQERDSTAEGYLDFAETILSEALARTGGLGLARLALDALQSAPKPADKG